MEPKNLKNERSKKILIIIVVLLLFGTTYYYYGYSGVKKSPESESIATKQDKKADKEAKKKSETKEKVQTKDQAKKNAEKGPEKEVKKTEKEELKVAEVKKEKKEYIRPTRKSELIASAMNVAGKKDPFSYTESGFSPFGSSVSQNQKQTSGNRQTANSFLPEPPSLDGTEKGIKNPFKRVNIKGFLGNKIILEVNGYSESLGENDELRGVKVLKINQENHEAELKIGDKTVTKKMKTILDDKRIKRVDLRPKLIK